MDFYKPTLQTKFNGEGNCLSAVISTLFDVNIDDVPVFADNEEEWVFELSQWMANVFNKFVLPVKLNEMTDLHCFCGSLVITNINSNNPECDRHAVITKNGSIVFDPMIGEVNIELSDDMDPTFILVGDLKKLPKQQKQPQS